MVHVNRIFLGFFIGGICYSMGVISDHLSIICVWVFLVGVIFPSVTEEV